MIHVDNLSKSFGAVRAVDGISFDVARGEVVGLLGPNGAGKTTTMRMITGYLPQDSGTITIDGIPVDVDATATRSRIGYLPESAPLYTDLEVVESLEYTAKLRNVPASECPRRIRAMIETCGLGAVIGRRIGELSKGYRQRVGLASAMLHEPPILILDEPTSGLDPNQIVEIRDLIRAIGRERTVILSTHILQEVEATCSRALIISNGKLAGQGTIEELTGLSHGSARYIVSLRASRSAIESRLRELSGFEFDSWISQPESERQRVVLRGTANTDQGEEVFRWAMASDLPLSELTRESATLEQVFRELTTSAQPS